MSDRSYFTLNVYSCPPDQLDALREAIGAMLDGEDFDFDESIEIEELRVEALDEHAAAIAEAAPGAIWEAVSEPAYEWLGTSAMHAPDLGLYLGSCSSGGTVVLGWNDIEQVMAAGGDRDALAQLFGRPWEAVIEPLRVARFAAALGRS